MKVLNFLSECTPEVNTPILRAVEEVVCEYREFLPNGWRVIIEMIRRETQETYYYLDLQSNKGGGDLAQIRASSGGNAAFIPYDILVTEMTTEVETPSTSKSKRPEQTIRETKGHVVIAFDGAADGNLNGFFEFWIFKRIQKILNKNWVMDQIWWNLRGFQNDTLAQFWIKTLKIKEVCK